jgi:hypothetical protein
MQIKLPNIIESRFMVYLQIVGRKIYKYDSLENIRKSEFERIGKFRPLPELDISSIPTLDVSEKERVDISIQGDVEEVQAELLETLNKAPNLVTQEVGIDLDEEQLVRGSLTSLDVVDDKLYLEGVENTSEGQINVLDEKFEDDVMDDDAIFENELFANDLEDNSELAFEEVGSDLNLVENKSVDVPEWVQFMNNVEPCLLKLDLKNIYFGYLGVADSSIIDKVKDEVKARQEVAGDTLSVAKSVTSKIVVEEPVQVVDRFARREGEDIVLYTRRLVRVSEVEVLKYFSPRELEIALERGNLLRKRGVIIFAHA